MSITTKTQRGRIEKSILQAFTTALLTLIILLYLFVNQVSAQGKVLKSARAMFAESKMDSASLLAEQSYQYFLNLNYLDSAAYSLAHKAAPVAFSTDMASGIGLIDRSLKLYANQDKRSPNIEIKIYSEAVRLYSEMSKADTVTYFLNKIEDLIENYPDIIDKKNVARFYWDLTYVQYLEADYPSALQSAHQAKKMYIELYGEDSGHYRAVMDWLATLYRDLSQYEESIYYARRSLENDTLISFNHAISNNNLASIYNNVGDLKNALFYNDKALDMGQDLVARKQIDKSYLFTFHSTRSRTYSLMGKLQESLLEFKKAESVLISNPDVYAGYLNSNIMQIYIQMDSLDAAKKYMAKTWSQYNEKSGGNLDDYSHFLGLDGSLDFNLELYSSGLPKLKKAIQIRDSIFDEPEYYITTIYETLGLTYCAMDSVDQAYRAYITADSIARLLFGDGHESTISYNINHAKCLYSHQQYLQGEQLLKDMIEEIGIDPISYQNIDWSVVVMQPQVLSLLAAYLEFQIDKVRRTSNEEHKAYLVKAVDNYIEYMERYIGFFDSFSSHLNIDKEYFETLAGAIDVMSDFENSDSYSAFIFKCIQKSKTLISRMVLNDVSMDHYKGVPDTIVQQELNLRSKLNMTAKQLMDKASGPSSSEDPFLSLEREYRGLQQQIQDQYPSYYNLKYDFSVPALSEIQSSLPEQSLYMDYFIADDFVILVTVNAHEYSINKLAVDAVTLQDLITALHDAILDVTSNSWEQYARQLYILLVEPLGIQIEEYRQIILCPDGPLYELPMELCMDESVIIPRPIMYVISANDVIPKKTKSEAEEVRILGFAPSFTHLKKSRILPQPFSRSLAENIQSRFEADIYFDQHASESKFKSLATDYPVLHISTHGILNEDDPLSSHLLLYEDSLNDGRLTLNELYGMQLKSNLAILNACSTSQGKFRKGAGMNSLASGFQFAGCSNLTTSLWPVDEQSNSKILTYLYDHLIVGDSPYSALVDAKKQYLVSAPPELRHPYYWAGITMIGIQDPIVSSGFSAICKVLFGGILLLILSLFVVRKRRTRTD